MSLREALTPKSLKEPKPAARKVPDIENVLERLIATLNRIESKLDKL